MCSYLIISALLVWLAHSSNATGFSEKLYDILARNRSDFIYSPLVLNEAFSALYQGADEDTKSALLHIVGGDVPQDRFQKLITDISKIKDDNFHIASKAYITKGVSISPEFESIVKDNFLTQIEPISFDEKEAAVNTINSWINQATSEKIPTICNVEDIDGETQIVLTNAIYLKNSFQRKIDESLTRTEPFYVDKDTTIDAQMMHTYGKWSYKSSVLGIDAQVIDLPLSLDGFSLTLALPFAKDGIENLESTALRKGSNRIFQNMMWRDTNISVTLPKFKLETVFDLTEPLKQLGAGVAFDKEKCKFNKMVDNPDGLSVSKVLQKVYIQVDEEGENPTNSVDHFTPFHRILSPFYEEFYANHPFLVYLRKDEHIYLYGKVTRPVSPDSEVAPRAEPSYNEKEVLRSRCLDENQIRGESDVYWGC